ncbi:MULTISPECIES: transcriptional regulator [Weissella]|uniref:transcriptional regulator n=1 Tax=Weissella TaxID=46255 RepID=UPI00119145EE|nr:MULTISPECIES: transcriptional regulator [Weissella]MDY2519621.1 transcriptional regulator [Weissella cibaria]MYV35331.1 transcriptional regulator [Weissella cibaria]TVV19203.1 transcriptional regulator [Weissella cibaria]WEY48231.1 transcriptional regulator [Weissella confusa]
MTATTIEEQEEALKRKIKKRIKDELWERDDMKQFQLAEMIGEGESQTNRAINGDNSPKSRVIRKKIFTLFNITDL